MLKFILYWWVNSCIVRGIVLIGNWKSPLVIVRIVDTTKFPDRNRSTMLFENLSYVTACVGMVGVCVINKSFSIYSPYYRSLCQFLKEVDRPYTM